MSFRIQGVLRPSLNSSVGPQCSIMSYQ